MHSFHGRFTVRNIRVFWDKPWMGLTWMRLNYGRKYSGVESGTRIVESKSSMILVMIDDHFGLGSLHHQSCAIWVSLVGISILCWYGLPDWRYTHMVRWVYTWLSMYVGNVSGMCLQVHVEMYMCMLKCVLVHEVCGRRLWALNGYGVRAYVGMHEQQYHETDDWSVPIVGSGRKCTQGL